MDENFIPQFSCRMLIVGDKRSFVGYGGFKKIRQVSL